VTQVNPLLRRILLLIQLFLLLGVATTHADSGTTPNTVLNNRFNIYLGGFFPRISSEIRLDADIDGGIGSNIKPEEILGLDDSSATVWGGLVWQISRRNNLEFEYFQLNRSATVDAVSRPFQIGQSQVQAGASTDTKLNLGIGRVTYAFSFYTNEKMKAKILGGLHWAEIEAEIKLSGQVSDISTGKEIEAGSSVTEGGSIGLPLPHLGFSYSYAILPTFLTRIQLMAFGLEFDNYAGLLLDGGVDFTYNPWRHFGFGAGFRYFDLRLEAEDGRLDGELNFRYWGPTLFLLLKF
jgi:hypothetical protein